MKKIILFLVFLALAHAEDYSKLLEYKQKYRHSTAVKQRALQQGKYANYVQITYYDINNLDTFSLKQKYNLELQTAIADGVLVFIYHGNMPIEKVIQKIKSQEKQIKDVRKYKSFHFKIL